MAAWRAGRGGPDMDDASSVTLRISSRQRAGCTRASSPTRGRRCRPSSPAASDPVRPPAFEGGGRTVEDVNSRLLFLFDPVEVAEVLGGLPHLRTAIPDPAQEGEESVDFVGMRKSERQLCRVLSNVHYEHLDALLRSLDFCIGRGFTQPTILRTRARGPFASALSELHVAEHFLGRGFELEPLDLAKGSDPVPEFMRAKTRSRSPSRSTPRSSGKASTS
jgi:hypothetical protein